MSSRRFAFRLLFPALLVSVTGCFALFPLDDFQNGAEAVDSGKTEPPPQRDATVDEASTPERDSAPPVKPEGRVVFLSSGTYNGNLGGITAADKICQELATNANLEGTFKAIVSGSAGIEETVGSRFGAGSDTDRKGLVLVDIRSNAIALNYAALLTDGPGDPIIYSERGAPIIPVVLDGGGPSCAAGGGLVWTNTNSNGTQDSDENCNDWQSEASGAQGRVGLAYVKAQWLSACTIACNTKAHLYCGQQ